MRINAAIRPRDDTRLAVYSETMITLIRPHSEQRTMIVWTSGPTSIPFRPSDLQCGQSTGETTGARGSDSATVWESTAADSSLPRMVGFLTLRSPNGISEWRGLAPSSAIACTTASSWVGKSHRPGQGFAVEHTVTSVASFGRRGSLRAFAYAHA
jgi:hypothetical protein